MIEDMKQKIDTFVPAKRFLAIPSQNGSFAFDSPQVFYKPSDKSVYSESFLHKEKKPP